MGAGCSVGEGEGGEPSFDLLFSSFLFLSFALLFAFGVLLLLLLFSWYTGTSMNKLRVFYLPPVSGIGLRPQTSPDNSCGGLAVGRRNPIPETGGRKKTPQFVHRGSRVQREEKEKKEDKKRKQKGEGQEKEGGEEEVEGGLSSFPFPHRAACPCPAGLPNWLV